MRGPKASIKSYLKISHIAIILTMAVPVVILSTLLIFITQRYNQLIWCVEQANQVISITERDLEKELWNIVTGNKPFGEGEQYILLNNAETILRDLIASDMEGEREQYLQGALKMTETLRAYCDQLDEQIGRNASVSDNEELLRETRRVTSSLRDVVTKYVHAKIWNISQINDSIIKATNINIALIALLVGLIILFVYRSYRIAQIAIKEPIAKLEKISIKFAEGDLNSRAPESSLEELEVLTASLNTMAFRLDELFRHRVNDQKNLRKAELRTLQEQIKPHFIYNTLGTIMWYAKKGSIENVVGITAALTNFLRVALSKGNDYISVQQEISHVESYLEIQRHRYGEKMKYSVAVDQRICGCKMLKLLLQPLVENALYHGIKEKRGIGEITVRSTDNRDGTMTFSVEDNGVGMSEERLGQVRRSIKIDEGLRNSNYGLFNVNKRIQLYYEGEGLTITSEYMRGTRVEFTIPCLGD